jgi:hypothetical protein
VRVSARGAPNDGQHLHLHRHRKPFREGEILNLSDRRAPWESPVAKEDPVIVCSNSAHHEFLYLAGKIHTLRYIVGLYIVLHSRGSVGLEPRASSLVS